MNNSSLPIYYSKESLSTRYADFANVYLLPSACGFGIITSFICVLVSFRGGESNAKSLDYILLNSLIDLLFLLCEIFVVIVRCGLLCPYGYTYGAKIYETYVFLYSGYILVTSQVLLSIYISYDRLSMFSGKVSAQKRLTIYKVYATCFLISAAANAPIYGVSRETIAFGIFMLSPHATFYEVLYKRRFKAEFQTPLANTLLTILSTIKNPVLYTVLTVLSVWVCMRFRAYLMSRKTLVKKVNTSKTFLLLTY
jgi:hypothetical protein